MITAAACAEDPQSGLRTAYKSIMSHISDLDTKTYILTSALSALHAISKYTITITERETNMSKASETAASNRQKRDAKNAYHRELLELMIMSLQIVLKDEEISNEQRFKAVTLMNELRKELHIERIS